MDNEFKMKYIAVFFWSLVVFLFALAFLQIIDVNPLVDELLHLKQIFNFRSHHFVINKDITMIPGYHFFIGMIISVLETAPIWLIRLISFLFCVLAIPVFHYLGEKNYLKTWEFAFFPIIFPFYFLIYTDLFSLLFVLLAFMFFKNKKYQISGIIMIMSLLIRQNNIIWIIYFFTSLYLEQYLNLKFEQKESLLKKFIRMDLIILTMKKGWIYLLGFGLFILFVFINQGIALGYSDMHPPFAFHTTNVFFLLFCHFILFLPLNIFHFSKIYRLLKNRKWIIAVLLLVFLLYLLTYKNSHPWNNFTGKFIRNHILIYFYSHPVRHILFFIPCAYSILSIWVTPLNSYPAYLVYPFTILYLLPSWLVEQRYYMLPFTFYLLFKKDENKWIEFITCLYYFILSFALYYFFCTEKVFL
ncbi:MAG: Dol-P-Glc:Glc(2)Man(9)GlcNAc(2)-PP-Dol alpha-1,2-glucosyltransferase [Spirochaetes bacterium]|nr:Dol-P-Glc:Glc(2)Man(9)GlcNAc(2)-PP-Dol alpha-1,2-glucosyltransferase [Spirochaetota bacterium]